MSVESLLAEIEAAGGRLEVRGAVLDVQAPRPLSEGLIGELRANKAALLARLGQTAVHQLDGVTALGDLTPDSGANLAHPWRGRQVNSPRGRGRLIWTDGYRAAVSTRPNACWFVDLADVQLVEG